MDFFLGRTSGEGVTAGAGYLRVTIVLGMYLFFHSGLLSVNANPPPVVADRFKFNHAVNRGEEGMVSAHADITAGMNLGAALAYQDGTGVDYLTGIFLDAQHLGFAIAAITIRAACLFMRHLESPLS